MARHINHAIQERANATQRGVEGAENSTSMFTGSKARQLCEVIRDAYGRLPKDLSREMKEILITEGISERVAYNKYGSMPWNVAEQDEFQKIVVNLECREGPYFIDDVRQHCGDEDTIAYLAYVYARKGIEKDKDGYGSQCEMCICRRSHQQYAHRTAHQGFKVLSESRRPPAAGWEIDLRTAASQLLRINRTRDVDITAAFPGVPVPYHGERHYVRARGRLLECLCEHFKVGVDTNLCWVLNKNLYGYPCAQDNFDAHLAFQLSMDGWKLLAPELTHHLWVKTEIQTVRKFQDLSEQPELTSPNITTISHERVVAMLVKYVDDCRWSATTLDMIQKTEDYLQLCYGKFRDSSDIIGVMLGKDYTYHYQLDGVHTTRLVMDMKSTEEKYAREALEFFDSLFGEWNGQKPKTPLSIPGTFTERMGEKEIQGDSNLNVVSEPQGQHVGRLGWLASKGRPELLESYRMHSSALIR